MLPSGFESSHDRHKNSVDFFSVFDEKKWNHTTFIYNRTHATSFHFLLYHNQSLHSPVSWLYCLVTISVISEWAQNSLWEREEVLHVFYNLQWELLSFITNISAVCQHSREAIRKVIILLGNLKTSGKRRVENVIWWKKDKIDYMLWVLRKEQSHAKWDCFISCLSGHS